MFHAQNRYKVNYSFSYVKPYQKYIPGIYFFPIRRAVNHGSERAERRYLLRNSTLFSMNTPRMGFTITLLL